MNLDGYRNGGGSEGVGEGKLYSEFIVSSFNLKNEKKRKFTKEEKKEYLG